MKNIGEIVKSNKCYLFCSVCGIICTTFGGICWDSIIGKVLLGIGILLSMASIILGVQAFGIYWEDYE